MSKIGLNEEKRRTASTEKKGGVYIDWGFL